MPATPSMLDALVNKRSQRAEDLLRFLRAQRRRLRDQKADARLEATNRYERTFAHLRNKDRAEESRRDYNRYTEFLQQARRASVRMERAIKKRACPLDKSPLPLFINHEAYIERRDDKEALTNFASAVCGVETAHLSDDQRAKIALLSVARDSELAPSLATWIWQRWGADGGTPVELFLATPFPDETKQLGDLLKLVGESRFEYGKLPPSASDPKPKVVSSAISASSQESTSEEARTENQPVVFARRPIVVLVIIVCLTLGGLGVWFILPDSPHATSRADAPQPIAQPTPSVAEQPRTDIPSTSQPPSPATDRPASSSVRTPSQLATEPVRKETLAKVAEDQKKADQEHIGADERAKLTATSSGSPLDALKVPEDGGTPVDQATTESNGLIASSLPATPTSSQTLAPVPAATATPGATSTLAPPPAPSPGDVKPVTDIGESHEPVPQPTEFELVLEVTLQPSLGCRNSVIATRHPSWQTMHPIWSVAIQDACDTNRLIVKIDGEPDPKPHELPLAEFRKQSRWPIPLSKLPAGDYTVTIEVPGGVQTSQFSITKP